MIVYSMQHTMLCPMVEIVMIIITLIGTYSPYPLNFHLHHLDSALHTRRIHWPPTADRDPEKKYEHGARLYGYVPVGHHLHPIVNVFWHSFGTPMLTIDAETYKKIGL